MLNVAEILAPAVKLQQPLVFIFFIRFAIQLYILWTLFLNMNFDKKQQPLGFSIICLRSNQVITRNSLPDKSTTAPSLNGLSL